jgi:hypothetical protein
MKRSQLMICILKQTWCCQKLINVSATSVPAKTRYMLFSHCKTNLTLWLMGHNILRIQESGPERSFKLVGVHLEEHMNWKHHITHVKQKMAGAMSLVCRAKHFLPRNIWILLYKSLINVHLDYCNILWGSTSQSVLKPLVSKQKKAIRLMLNAPYNSHTDPLLAKIFSLKFVNQNHLNV